MFNGSFQGRKEKLERDYIEVAEKLRKDVNAYSAALLARDDFKPMTDDEIKDKIPESRARHRLSDEARAEELEN